MAAAVLIQAPWVWAAKPKSEWNEKKSQHFVVFYKDAPKDFVDEVIRSAEQYYIEITRDFGFTRYESWSYDSRAKIYIYKDQDDYVNSARQANWSHGAAFAKSKTIRTFPAAHGFFDSLLPHELGHIIFREFVGHNVSLPRWFEEGVAMYQEKSRRWGAHKTVKDAIDRGVFIPLKDLNRSLLDPKVTDEVVDLFYAESASVIYFLIKEFGENRFETFCRKLKYGSPFFEAMKGAYGRFGTIEELNQAWVDYLKKKL
jgi:hypothetical protein